MLVHIVEYWRSYWRAFAWDRFLLAFCAGFHLVVASWLAAAPTDQVVTTGTAPALHWASRYEWAAVFFLLAVGVACQARVRWPWLRLSTWVGVLFVGGLWLTAFGLAVLEGEGSGAFIGWGFLYLLFGVVAFRLGLRKR